MGFLFGGKKSTNDTKPDYTGLQIQSSATGLPIPICWGTSKMAPALIWYGDFKTVSHTSSQGGKGGGAPNSTSYTYTTSFIMALCEGQIDHVGSVWQGQSVSASPAALNMGLLTGYSGQSWSYMTTYHPAEALDYSYTACIVAGNYDLGSSATLPNNNFEVFSLFVGTMSDQGNNVDADIGQIVQDFLTNSRYGAGFPAAFIDTNSMVGGTGTSSLRAFCRAAGLGMSPFLTSQEQATSILERWMQLTMTAAVWNGSVLKFIPYFPYTLSGTAGWTWTAPTTVVFSLTDSDFVRDGSNDPVVCSRNDTADAYNVMRLEILDKSNSYQTLIVEQRDEAHINQYGLRIAPTVQAHEYTDASMASLVAWLLLQRGLTVRNTYKFTLSWEYCVLDPMDLVEITDPVLGLLAQPVRITDIEENADFTLNITAEEFVDGVSAVAYPAQANAPVVVTTNTAPASVNTPMVFEPPSAMVSTPQVWAALSGGVGGVVDPYWGGCQVWVSTDNVNFTLVGQQIGPARMGQLTASLATYTGAAPDSAHTLSVNLAESAGTLQSVSSTDAADGVTSCWIGGATGEALSFQTATLTSANNYNLTTLYRGIGGTGVQAHSAGDNFCRLDSQIFKYDLPAAYVGQLLYFKFPSFNIWGNALQDMGAVTTYTYDPNGSGQTLADNWVWSQLISGQNVDCGTAGTTVVHAADAGFTDTASIGNVNLGITT